MFKDGFLGLLFGKVIVSFSYLQTTVFGDIMVSTSGIQGPLPCH